MDRVRGEEKTSLTLCTVHWGGQRVCLVWESGPCAVFEKGTDHADVVNYKAGMVHGASQRVCVSVFVPPLVHAFLSA